MKNIIYLSILLISAVGFSQDKVSAKSDTPVEATIIKKKVSSVNNQKKVIVKNDIVLVKQITPVENRNVNFIGTPKITYIEQKPLVKNEKL